MCLIFPSHHLPRVHEVVLTMGRTTSWFPVRVEALLHSHQASGGERDGGRPQGCVEVGEGREEKSLLVAGACPTGGDVVGAMATLAEMLWLFSLGV